MRTVLRGELARSLAGPEQAEALDGLQAAMAVVEGYAEHVMDAALADESSLDAMRSALARRRHRRGGLGDIIGRALGMGQKLEQYERGKAFCDEVVATDGIGALNRVWDSAKSLPGPTELTDPHAWLERVTTLSPSAL